MSTHVKGYFGCSFFLLADYFLLVFCKNQRKVLVVIKIFLESLFYKSIQSLTL